MIAALLVSGVVLIAGFEAAHAQERRRTQAQPDLSCSIVHKKCVGGDSSRGVNDQALEKCQRSRAHCLKTGVYRFPDRDLYGLVRE